LGEVLEFKCSTCSYVLGEPRLVCPKCGGIVLYDHKRSDVKWEVITSNHGIWRFSSLLPKLKERISMEEGFTPIFNSKNIGSRIGLHRLWFKDECRNPTGSFRDRVSAIILSHALSIGVKEVICASDGNLGASIAAYCSRIGLQPIVVVPKLVDVGKVIQMRIHGAKIIEYGNTLDEATRRAHELAEKHQYYEATAETNCLSIEGLKTIAYEIYYQLEEIPEHIIVPTGSGITALSICLGFKQLVELGLIEKTPKIHIVQSTTCPTIALSMKYIYSSSGGGGLVIGLSYCENPLADRIARILSSTGGYGVIVSLNEIYESTIELAQQEGLFVEPAAGAAVAGLKLLADHGVIGRDEDVVVLLTGTGLKALETFIHHRKHLDKYIIPSTKLQILKVLYERGEMHGYGIWKTFLSRITPQAIYQHLSELEARGLVKSFIKNRRKVYVVTEKGRRVVEVINELY